MMGVVAALASPVGLALTQSGMSAARGMFVL